MSRLDVSAVVTTCNRAALVGRAVQSVLGQSHPPLECLVIDDSSTDDTGTVLERLAAADPRIKVLRHATRQGLSAARNSAIAAARAPLIAFLDDDDVWLPAKLERQVARFAAAPPEVALIYCWFAYLEAARVVGGRRATLEGRVFEHVLEHQPLGNGSTMLIRTAVARALGGFDTALPRGIDGDFVRRLARAHEIRCVPEVLVHVHVAHGFTRITEHDRTGARNALAGEHAKLRKFAAELERYPRQRAAIYGTIGFLHTLLGEWALAARWYGRAFRTRPLAPSTWRTLLRAAKGWLGRRPVSVGAPAAKTERR